MKTEDNKQLPEKVTFRNIIKVFTGGSGRVIRFLVLVGIITHFFSFGIAPSSSMYPTIHVKDMMIFQKTKNFERGDIISFHFPLDEKQIYLKRIIGVEGDEIAIKDGYVYVNGDPLEEPYIYEQPQYEMELFVVPEDKLFVLGDNRNDSYDSSQWGFVDKEKVKGKVLAVILPFEHMKPGFSLDGR